MGSEHCRDVQWQTAVEVAKGPCGIGRPSLAAQEAQHTRGGQRRNTWWLVTSEVAWGPGRCGQPAPAAHDAQHVGGGGSPKRAVEGLDERARALASGLQAERLPGGVEEVRPGELAVESFGLPGPSTQLGRRGKGCTLG